MMVKNTWPSEVVLDLRGHILSALAGGPTSTRDRFGSLWVSGGMIVSRFKGSWTLNLLVHLTLLWGCYIAIANSPTLRVLVQGKNPALTVRKNGAHLSARGWTAGSGGNCLRREPRGFGLPELRLRFQLSKRVRRFVRPTGMIVAAFGKRCSWHTDKGYQILHPPIPI